MIIFEFHTVYVLPVLALLWLICCFKSVIEFTRQGCESLDQCCQNVWGIIPCIDKPYSVIFRQCLIIFCYVQPIIFCGIYVYNQADEKHRRSSTAYYTVQPYLNRSQIVNEGVEAEFAIIEVDLIFAIIPFSFAVSVCSMSWVNLISSSIISENTPWDDSMEEPVAYYELSYYLETFCMNLVYIAFITETKSALSVYLTAFSISLLMCYFISEARYHRESQVQHLISSCALLLLFAVLVPFWSILVDLRCHAKTAILLAYSFNLLIIINFHFVACGNFTASTILSIRIIMTMLTCLVFIVVYTAGLDQLCQYNSH